MAVFCFTGEFPISGISALPHMDIHHRLYFSRDPQFDDASVCIMSADTGSMSEENLASIQQRTEPSALKTYISD